MTFQSGDKPGPGNYVCTTCDEVVTLKDNSEALPECPVCGAEEFVRE